MPMEKNKNIRGFAIRNRREKSQRLTSFNVSGLFQGGLTILPCLLAAMLSRRAHECGLERPKNLNNEAERVLLVLYGVR